MRRRSRLAALLRLPLLSSFFFNDTATTEIYTLSLHDALPIWARFADLLATREEFKERYGAMNDRQYVEAITANTGQNIFDRAQREKIAAQLSAARVTRAGVLLRLASDDNLARRESDAALITLHYFYFLERDPDPAGFAAWMRALATMDRQSLTPSFTGSIEYQRKHREGG